MINTVQRYAWEDELIAAQAEGQIKNGALLVALKLARAINWAPKDGRPSGLYWKNEDALKAVGASRTTYFDHRAALFAAGFLTEVAGNLIPTLPESVVRTEESVVRTEQSVVRNPYSEDIYSEDSLSENNTKATVVADAPTVSSSSQDREVSPIPVVLGSGGASLWHAVSDVPPVRTTDYSKEERTARSREYMRAEREREAMNTPMIEGEW